VITESNQSNLDYLRSRLHAQCTACGPLNSRGLNLNFVVCHDGSVQASFACTRDFSGYEDRLHGGIISTVLDSAMTNCLFAYRKTAVTAELTVRFRQPVAIDKEAVVRAWLAKSVSSLYILHAEIVQDGGIKASAIGKFILQARK